MENVRASLWLGQPPGVWLGYHIVLLGLALASIHFSIQFRMERNKHTSSSSCTTSTLSAARDCEPPEDGVRDGGAATATGAASSSRGNGCLEV